MMNSSELNFSYICLLGFFLIVAKYLLLSLINTMISFTFVTTDDFSQMYVTFLGEIGL